MELLRDILKYLLGAHAWRVAHIAVPAAAALALLLGVVYALNGPGGSPQQRADAVVPAQPMTRVETLSPAGTGSPGGAAGTGQAGTRPPPASGSELIRTIQGGLVRATCYDGPVNGFWTRKSKDAMGRFVAVLNAKLPVGQPDQVMLALIDANPNARCQDGQSVATAAPPPRPQPPETARPAAAAEPPRPTVPPAAPGASSPPPVAAEAAAPERPFGVPLAAAATAGATVAAAATGSSAQPVAEAKAEQPPERSIGPPLREAARTTASRRGRSRRPETAFDGVSKSMSRNFRSLQRSLSSIFP